MITGDDPEFEVTIGDSCIDPPVCGASRPYKGGPYVDARFGYVSCALVNSQLEAKLCVIVDNSNIWAHAFESTYVPGELVAIHLGEFTKQ